MVGVAGLVLWEGRPVALMGEELTVLGTPRLRAAGRERRERKREWTLGY